MSKAKTPVEDAGATDTAAATAASAPAADVLEQASSDGGEPTSGPVPSEPVSISPEQLSEAIRRGIEKWCNEHFFDNPVSRATEALNYLREQGVPDLEAKILKEVF